MMTDTTPAFVQYAVPDLPKTVVFGVSAEYVTLEVAIRSVQEVTMQAFEEFAQMIEVIPTVEAVHGQAAGTYLHLITYTSQSLEEERYRVYDAELQITAKFPNLDFEFDLVDRRGYPATWVESAVSYTKLFRELPNTEDEHGFAEH